MEEYESVPVFRSAAGLYETEPHGRMVGAILAIDGRFEAYHYGRRPDLFLGEFNTIGNALGAFYVRKREPPPQSRIRQRMRSLQTRIIWCGSTRWCECGKSKFHFGHSEERSPHACEVCRSQQGRVQCYSISDQSQRVWLHQTCEQNFLDQLRAA